MNSRMDPGNKRRWFQVHCCKGVVNAAPVAQPSFALGIGYLMAGLTAMLLVGVMIHVMGLTGTAGVVLANAPVVGFPEIEHKLGNILTQITEQKTKAEAEQKRFGEMLGETKDKLEKLQAQADALDTKLTERHLAAQPGETLEESLKNNDDLKSFMTKKSGNVVIQINAKHTHQLFERKTLIDSTAVGVQTTGVMQIERIPGITEEARQELTIRNLLSARSTSMQVIDFVKVNAPMTVASPQTEGALKKENAVTFTSESERVRTLATWIPAAKQVLDDFGELMGFIMSSMPYYVNLAEERQLLTGAGSGEDLHGLITQATSFNTGLLPVTGTYNRIDVIGRVIQQITTAKELQPTFICLNPVDWWSIRLTKDTQGRYILGDPMGPVAQQQLFGLTPVITTSVASGTFLVGSGSPIAAEIRDRMGMTIEIATQHDDYFARNLIAIRAEKRLALVVRRPASFITGSFITSP